MATPDSEALDNATAAADADPQRHTVYWTQADALFRKNLTYQVLTTQPNPTKFTQHCMPTLQRSMPMQ